MKKFISLIIVLVVAFSAASSAVPNEATVISESVKSCVFINAYTDETNHTSGSGFAVEGNRVVTCYHVVKTYKTIEVRDYQNRLRVVTKKILDPKADTAILYLDSYIRPLPIFKNYNTGDTVYSISTPKIMSLMNTVGRGIISNNDRFGKIQFDIPLNIGCSGGAIINERGQVIGMIQSIIIDPQIMSVSFAIPISKIKL